jgi:hypothetical protein
MQNGTNPDPLLHPIGIASICVTTALIFGVIVVPYEGLNKALVGGGFIAAVLLIVLLVLRSTEKVKKFPRKDDEWVEEKSYPFFAH